MEVSFEVNQIKKTLTTHTMDRGLSEKKETIQNLFWTYFLSTYKEAGTGAREGEG